MRLSPGILFVLGGVLTGCEAGKFTTPPDAALPPPDAAPPPPDAAPPPPDAMGAFFPCDVEAALKAKCHTCHTMPPLMGAPFPLLEYANTQMNYAAGKVWQAMQAAIQTDFMPLAGSPTGPLTPAEKMALLDWLGRGAPAEPQACPTGN